MKRQLKWLQEETRMDWQWHRLAETPSTQLEARRLVETAPGCKRVVIAERQLAGRGRRGNLWESPPGGLWCTLVMPLERDPDPFLNLLLGLAVQKGVGLLLPNWPPLSIKWPNDLMVCGKKWGGILSEVMLTPQGTEVLMGVGLNLQISSQELHRHPEVPSEATTILAEFGQSPSPEEALESILKEFDASVLEDLKPGGRSRNQLRVASVLDTIGRKITWLDLEGQQRRGEAISLTEDGALIVETESSGQPRRVELRSAEIRHVRDLSDSDGLAEEC
ncbi:biotin--[acetyl-CoA-carboxylase] ligase [bacterium TMED181]|nr:biotin--[acetyl-CoA-carboxylase] ligase [Planctomycetota bacterium]OUW43525.1 MAG: biotin--[acetyl-CoA-carboxylase] ligase [bacterium TMED181]